MIQILKKEGKDHVFALPDPFLKDQEAKAAYVS
jgi:hypothetical protein